MIYDSYTRSACVNGVTNSSINSSSWIYITQRINEVQLT